MEKQIFFFHVEGQTAEQTVRKDASSNLGATVQFAKSNISQRN